MSALIAAGTTLTTFAAGEFTVSAGTTVSLMIVGAADGGIPAGVDFVLARKSAGGQYVSLINLNAGNILAKGNIQGGATDIVYAAMRLASSVSAGLDKN